MDFQWTEDETAFRLELREWLTENLRGRGMGTYQGVDPDALRSWEQALKDASLNAISWPKEFGGQGFDPTRTLIFNEEYDLARAPRRLNFPALGLLGPTLMAVGTPEQQRTLLPRILSCEDVWCQGFSEPGAGSDLSSLTTSARRDGDEYIVNGQKTWCSNASRANKVFALVRTSKDGRKSEGITYLLIDLNLDGVEVRPIKQVNGGSEFAEVFFSDVHVPASGLVGAENDGWKVARTTLGIERGASRYPGSYFQRIVDDVEAIIAARSGGAIETDRIELARMQADVECWKVDAYAGVTSDRPDLKALNAVFKISRTEMQQRMYEHGLRAMGPAVELLPDSLPPGITADFYQRYWHARASSIYAGTNEIQRSLIAEGVLGLPREPRA